VLVRQARSVGLDRLFPVLAPIEVRCWGQDPVGLEGGGRGYNHVRWTTSLNAPDFIYHLDRRGRLFVTRSW
jgi:hypothetical protein